MSLRIFAAPCEAMAPLSAASVGRAGAAEPPWLRDEASELISDFGFEGRDELAPDRSTGHLRKNVAGQ